MNNLPARYAPKALPPAALTMIAAATDPPLKRIGSLLLLMSALVAPAAWAQAAGSCHASALPSITPTALYRFEGNLLDSSGTADNLTQVTGTTSYSTNRIEGATSASSTGTVGLNAAPYTNSFSVMSASMFIKPTSGDLTGDHVFYDLGFTDAGILLSINNGNLVLEFDRSNSSADGSISVPFPTDGQWHQVGYVFDATGAGTVSLYLDGHPVASSTVGGNMSATTGGLGLFAQYGGAADGVGTTNGSRPYAGLMDDVAIYYGTALTPKNMLDVADCAGAALGIDFNLLDRQLTPMACETEAYLMQDINSEWYSIDLVTGTSVGPVADNYNDQINAAGYNLIDGRIWGSAFNGRLFSAVKNAATGAWTVQLTGAIPGLATGGTGADQTGLYTGDVNAAGELVMYSGNAGSQTVYVVDVNPGSATYLSVTRTFTINLGSTVTMYDWAFNPIDGKLYGVSNDGNLYQVNPATGAAVNLGVSGALANGTYGAVYFDLAGYLYASRNTGGNIYRIDLRTSPGTNYDETKTVLFSVSGASEKNDGARCANAPVPIDFGDAPDTALGTGTGNYKTLLADDGPRHGIIGFVQATNTAKLSLGSGVTLEVDGKPNADATGDVDDGMTWPSLLILGESYNVPVTLVNQTGANAYLNAWVDYNQDGVFAPGEQVSTDQVVANGATAASIAFTVPTTNVVLNGATTFARVRLCSRALDCNLSTGPAFGGEVEDHGYILLTGPDYDDLPASYGTYKANGGARHLIIQMAAAFGSPGTTPLMLGSALSLEADARGVLAINDTVDDGVTFESDHSGGPGLVDITAHVTGVNSTGQDAMLCGYLDGGSNGAINGTFERSLSYTTGQVGLSAPTINGPTEELCVQVKANGSATNLTISSVTGFNGASASCSGSPTFTCQLLWHPNYPGAVTTYARLRLTTDAAFFSTNSPAPSGTVMGGEVEGYALNIQPTAATIGQFAVSRLGVAEALAALGDEGLRDLLASFDPERAAQLAGAERAALLAALGGYLDPDGDGRVALLHWQTLEERGTIGFYTERRGADGRWQRINNTLLPGLITAPMGGDYWLFDPAADDAPLYEYRLIEQEAQGATRTHGPFRLEALL